MPVTIARPDARLLKLMGDTMSHLERDFLAQCERAGLPPVEVEVVFHPTIRWRIDGAIPVRKLGYEIDGGTRAGQKSRHTSPAGYERDCEKLAEAAILGWRILRFTAAMVEDGRALALWQRALEGE
jgi:hypothetical protein